MTEPTTEAGRGLLEFLYPQHGGAMRTDAVAARIIAIEAEARASLDVTLLRRIIEEALVDDESGMETFDADVVAREYARIIRERSRTLPGNMRMRCDRRDADGRNAATPS